MMKAPSLSYGIRVGILFAIYVVTAQRGLMMDAVGGFATAVWPPTGISLAALCLFGYRLWPGIALGAFVVNASKGAPLPTALAMATGNTLEALVGAYLFRRAAGSSTSLDRLRDVIGLVLAAGLSTLVSATIGVASGRLGGVFSAAEAGRAWWTWWVGDMMGDLILAPVLLTWSGRPSRRLSARGVLEAGALTVAAAGIGILVFGSPSVPTITHSPYLLFPLLIWTALRFSPRGAALAIFGVSAVAIGGTARGFGPFAQDTLNESLLLLHTFMSVAAITTLVLAANVAERKALEEALRQRAHELAEADRRKDEFLAMLAHELRNPLAPIRNAVQLLQQFGPAEPRLARVREIIDRQVRHQARLLDDLLDVSRITQGKVTLRRERHDLVPLLREVADDNSALLQAAGLHLTVDLPEEPVWVDGDSVRLAQVVSNLLQNAIKFTEPGGRVSLGCWVLGVGCWGGREEQGSLSPRLAPTPNTQYPTPAAVITVRDTGIGIDPVMLPRVFEVFTQGDRSLDRSRGGLGLGLALVKGLVDLHQGEVRAHSEGAGRGAEFTALLPLAPAPDAPEPQPLLEAAASPAIRVLIVEDNRDAADTLRDLLELSGHRAEVAYAGPEAVARAREFGPDVVLCDLGLPGMDGYEVARTLRREGTAARLIAMSGYGQEEDVERSRRAGFDLHLTKPVNPVELQRLLEAGPGPS